MARSSARRPAPRPAPRAAPQQARHASTAPVVQHQAPPVTHAQPQQPGMFAQMASTAAGVAVGSTVGHTIGAGITGLFGGSSSAPVEQQQQLPAEQQYASSAQVNQEAARACDADARNFTRCLDDNNGNFQICDYYLQQLKACQEAARQY